MSLQPGWFLIAFFYSVFFISIAQAEEFDMNKVYSNNDCLACHKKNNPDLVRAWQDSSHSDRSDGMNSASMSLAKANADCVQCHGASHKDAAEKSRSDSACVNCHGGNKAPVVHSYRTSKHGVIMQMTKKKVDWNKPLKSANYRVPGCAYCHMYDSQHNTKESIRNKDEASKNHTASENSEDLLRQTLSVCSDCHAPRYIRRLFENGERMKNIAEKKINEAQVLVNNIINYQIDTPQQKSVAKKTDAIKKQFHKMEKHFKNVNLGIAHQSPDYQWWHGQPALDGDLIRIKALISDLQRETNINMASE